MTALLARSELGQVRSELTQLRTAVTDGRTTDARSVADELGNRTRRAHHLTTGPAWWAASSIPLAGDPLDSMRGTTTAADVLGRQTLPDLISIANDLDPAHLRVAGNRVDVARLAAAAPALHREVGTLRDATSRVRALPAHTWLTPVDHGRDALLTEMVSLSGTLTAADRAAQIMPTMLGSPRPMRYFLGLQNEAEARGTGGLPGTFAILLADHGSLRITHIGTDSELNRLSVGLNFGLDYTALYGTADPTGYIGNSNISPHFPYAAQIWAAMWQKKSGQHVDGALALDPTSLGYLLAVTGPARTADGTAVTASNVVALTQKDAYARFPDSERRKQFLVGVTRAAEGKLFSGSGSPARLVRAAGRAATERRLLVWSSDAAVESVLAQTSLAGVIPQGDGAYGGLVLTNSAASKLDYYTQRQVSWRRSPCDVHDVTVTITLRNSAPATVLPSYVTNRGDRHSYPVRPGDNRMLVNWYASAGSTLSGVTVDGKRSLAGSQRERGHPVYVVDLELPRGATRVITLHLRDPSRGTPQMLVQPLITPQQTQITQNRCGA